MNFQLKFYRDNLKSSSIVNVIFAMLMEKFVWFCSARDKCIFCSTVQYQYLRLRDLLVEYIAMNGKNDNCLVFEEADNCLVF